MTSEYNKLTNGVKTITIIIYKEKRLRIYNRQYIVFYKFYLIILWETIKYSYIGEQEAALSVSYVKK